MKASSLGRWWSNEGPNQSQNQDHPGGFLKDHKMDTGFRSNPLQQLSINHFSKSHTWKYYLKKTGRVSVKMNQEESALHLQGFFQKTN